MKIKLEKYYGNCIRLKSENLAEKAEMEGYVWKTGLFYVLGEQIGEYGKTEENVFHITNVPEFLDRCKNDGVKVECNFTLQDLKG